MLKAENWLGEKLFQTEERVKCKSSESRVYLLSFWNSDEAAVAEADSIYRRVIWHKAREMDKGKILVSCVCDNMDFEFSSKWMEGNWREESINIISIKGTYNLAAAFAITLEIR